MTDAGTRFEHLWGRVALAVAITVSLSLPPTVATAGDKTGVVRNKSAAGPGANLSGSARSQDAWLFDLKGETLHHWRVLAPPAEGGFGALVPLAQGGLLALLPRRSLVRLDPSANIQWRARGRFHDAAAALGDSAFALARSHRQVEHELSFVPFLDDRIEVFGLDDGVRRDAISLFDLFEDRVDPAWMERVANAMRTGRGALALLEPGGPGDLLRAASLEPVGWPDATGAPSQALLLALPVPGLVAAIAPGPPARVLWSTPAGQLTHPVAATLSHRGRVLAVERHSERTRILELDPVGGAAPRVWAEVKDLPTPAAVRLQALPGGTVLVSDRETGRTLEVTSRGKTVWEFRSREGAATGLWRVPDASISWVGTAFPPAPEWVPIDPSTP